MKKTFVASILCICFLFSISSAQNIARKNATIEAKIVKVGIPPRIRSGARRAVYQLVKYEALKVLKGKYKGKFIVVDHLIIFDTDIINFQEGDIVILEITPRRNIYPENFEKGIVEKEEKLKVRYQGRITLKQLSAVHTFQNRLKNAKL